MRKKIVAGNWKMNKELMEALQLSTAVIQYAQNLSDEVEVVLAPPSVYLHIFNAMRKDAPQLKIAAQNCAAFEEGAYTGELSAKILKSIDVDYVILGHSERRKYFNESASTLKAKVDEALSKELNVIFCCGEPDNIRDNQAHEAYIQQQLEDSLFHLAENQMPNIVLAYEPIWAIGTGKTATPEQAQQMHAFIRGIVAKKYNTTVAENLTILYGGSCKPSNAASIFAQKDVDGGLIGGASLVDKQFLTLVDELHN
jgi:triosephosphate isomerase (TIM)